MCSIVGEGGVLRFVWKGAMGGCFNPGGVGFGRVQQRTTSSVMFG